MLPRLDPAQDDRSARAPTEPARGYSAELRRRLDAARGLRPHARIELLAHALRVCTREEAAPIGSELVELAVATGPAPTPSSSLGSVRGPVGDPATVQALRVKYGLAAAPRASWWDRVRESVKGPTPSTHENGERALAALAETWTFLPPDVRQLALPVGQGRWARIGAALRSQTDPVVLRSLADLAGDAADASLAPLAARAIEAGDDAAVRAGERALFVLSLLARREHWSDHEVQAWQRAAQREYWGLALARGLMVGLRGDHSVVIQTVERLLREAPERQRRAAGLAALVLMDRTHATSEAARPGGGSAISGLFRMLSNAEHPGEAVLASTLRASRLPHARLRAMEWLGVDGLSPRMLHAARARLASAHALLDHELVLRNVHLALRPRRTARLVGTLVKLATPEERRGSDTSSTGAARIASGGACPTPAEVSTLDVGARRGLAAWTARLTMPAPVRVSELGGLLTDGDASVRATVLAHHPPTRLLPDLAIDSDARIAGSAYLALDEAWDARRPRTSAVHGAGADEPTRSGALGRALQRSPHARVRAWARGDHARHDALLDPLGAPRPGEADAAPDAYAWRCVQAWRQLRDDREATVMSLRDRVRAADATICSAALRLVRAMGLCAEFIDDLSMLALARGTEHDAPARLRIAASAASALGQVDGAESVLRARVALERAMQHEDARVRANALEAMERLAPVAGHPALGVAELKHWARDTGEGGHRARANAMRALWRRWLRDPRAASEQAHTLRDELLGGLGDARAAHRLASVWVASRVLPVALGRMDAVSAAHVRAQVEEVARFDDDHRVRTRAGACAVLLEASPALRRDASAAKEGSHG